MGGDLGGRGVVIGKEMLEVMVEDFRKNRPDLRLTQPEAHVLRSLDAGQLPVHEPGWTSIMAGLRARGFASHAVITEVGRDAIRQHDAPAVIRQRGAPTVSTIPAPAPGATTNVSDRELSTCVVCGVTDHGGNGRWACHVDEDVTPVCTGPCFRAYTTEKAALAAEKVWTGAFKRWSRP